MLQKLQIFLYFCSAISCVDVFYKFKPGPSYDRPLFVNGKRGWTIKRTPFANNNENEKEQQENLSQGHI
jgi:hypothetical protein